MNILLVGNGGREHALAWKMKQSPLCDKLYIAPGNPGTGLIGENVPIASEDFHTLGQFCQEKKIDLVVVGPEAPLVKGLRDYFESNPWLKDILIVGPGKNGAQLEGSKDFSKQFMLRNGIPTAKAQSFTVANIDQAFDYINTCKPPIVLKADGLAAGKGVIISLSQAEAKAVIKDMLVNKRFGEASSKVLIEEFLSGIELSVFVLTDGKDYIILPEAKDYKRIGEGDSGPNTGGMGAVSPVVFASKDFMQKVENLVVKPTIAGLNREAIDYKGFIFVGLMNVGGEPFVIEYNARMGDPETQAVMPRIKSDLVELLLAAAKGELQGKKLEVEEKHAVTVALVSAGYPGDYEKGKMISGLKANPSALVFHAGTRRNQQEVLTDGGRVLAITGRGDSIEEARENAYMCASEINWDGIYFRKDIGVDLMNYKGHK
jgi:phosphoribosylamine---glycine ligase